MDRIFWPPTTREAEENKKTSNMNYKTTTSTIRSGHRSVLKTVVGGWSIVLAGVLAASNCVQLDSTAEDESCYFALCASAYRVTYSPAEWYCSSASSDRECFESENPTTIHLEFFEASNPQAHCSASKPYCNWNIEADSELDVYYWQCYQDDTMCY